MPFLDRLVQNPLGALVVLAVAAFLETWGDSFFQAAFYRSTGLVRVLLLAVGTVVLGLYASIVNIPRWHFGKLLGIYVVLFFLATQLLARIRFGQVPSPPIYFGGAMMVIGGAIMAFWNA